MDALYIKNTSGKFTFRKSLIDKTEFFKYEVFDIKIFIWSIYSPTVGIKNIDLILDKYFNNIYIYQNDYSLYNYNLIQSELK
jgi:hypothetical protein